MTSNSDVPAVTSKAQAWRQVLIAVVVAGTLGLLVNLHHDRMRVRDKLSVLEATLSEERSSRVVLKAERDGLFARYATQTLGEPMLAGQQVFMDQHHSTEVATADGVFYIMSTTCLACEENLPMLAKLHRTNGIDVTAVSTRDSLDDLRQYQQAHAIGFPLVLASAGSLLSTMPLHGTPLTIVIRDRQIRWLKSGRLTARDSSAIHQELASVIWSAGRRTE